MVFSHCVPVTNSPSNSFETNSSSTRSPSGSSTGSSSNSKADQTPFGKELDQDLFWYHQGKQTADKITVDSNAGTVVYLRGKMVEEFLNSSFHTREVTKNEETGVEEKNEDRITDGEAYCMVFHFSSLETIKQLRVRVTPTHFNNLTLGRVEKLLRVDLPEKSTNDLYCSGEVSGVSNSSEYALDLSSVCPNCTNFFSSSTVSFHESSGTSLLPTIVPVNYFNPEGLNIRINPLNDSTSISSVCDPFICQTQGFDCCLNNQCVKDASEKPNAKNSSDYFQATVDINNDPLNFKNYPNLFYICPQDIEQSEPDNTTTAGVCSDPQYETKKSCEDAGKVFTAADEVAFNLFELYKKEYYCLEGAKEEDYASGTCTNSSFLSSTSCEAAGETFTFNCYGEEGNPGGSVTDFYRIRASVWDRCGCHQTPFPDSIEDNVCPDFGLRALKDPAGEITQIICDVPPPDLDLPPFQFLNISVPARSAPHRMFFEDGEHYDELTMQLSPEQENLFGQSIDEIKREKLEKRAITDINATSTDEKLEQPLVGYVDKIKKINFNGSTDFSIHDVIGQMSINLSQAMPAVVVNVEFDQNYIVRALDGYFDPCPLCNLDYWFQSFSPYPPSNAGRGLESIGGIAARDNYFTNITLGNYEDTNFGRSCWVPPTMIAGTHFSDEDTTGQRARRKRLKTQTALFLNGYKKDWYGFNLGALIGSFDGVNWFAAGGGRRVRATSNKLFLAINYPFSDMPSPTNINASIIQDNGINVASDYDYDPNLSSKDARRDSGASCQKFHQCDNDADCVTQLGWEYMCADVSQHRAYVPRFDFNAEEKEDEDNLRSSIAFNRIIHGGLPDGSKKRCVYRGAGAICKLNFSQGHTSEGEQTYRFFDSTAPSDPNTTPAKTPSMMEKQKLVTCAPNFFCASLTSNKFNNSIVREPNNPTNILYGQNANILGRPTQYSGGGERLTYELPTFGFPEDAIAENLSENLKLYYREKDAPEDMKNQWGICRPGKKIDADGYILQHSAAHSNAHSDYVSQISSCNPDDDRDNGRSRVQSCPIFDMIPFEEGDSTSLGDKNPYFLNYIFYKDGQANVVASNNTTIKRYDSDKTIRALQNSCGKSAQDSSGNSIFEDIELSAAPSSFTFPAITKIACVRKAGSICHTNLDCGPNKHHRAVAETYGTNVFGGTHAEKLFWEEDLICGQAQNPPFLSEEKLKTYSVRNNRCCRQVGKKLTMFSEGDTDIVTSLVADGASFSSESLETSRFTYANPKANNRYSRYEILGNLISEHTLNENGNTDPFDDITTINENEFVIPRVDKALNERPAPYQWRTIHETGRRSCCGGGFVRKFADGTNDWRVRDRLNITPRDFTCLNYRNELAEAIYDEEVKARIIDPELHVNFDNDYLYLCVKPQEGQYNYNPDDGIGNVYHGNGCIQVPLKEVDQPHSYNVKVPTLLTDGAGYTALGLTGSGQASIKILPIQTGTNVQDDDDGTSTPVNVSIVSSSDDNNLLQYERRLNVNAPFFPAPVENGVLVGFDNGATPQPIIYDTDDTTILGCSQNESINGVRGPFPYAMPIYLGQAAVSPPACNPLQYFGGAFYYPSYAQIGQPNQYDLLSINDNISNNGAPESPNTELTATANIAVTNTDIAANEADLTLANTGEILKINTAADGRKVLLFKFNTDGTTSNVQFDNAQGGNWTLAVGVEIRYTPPNVSGFTFHMGSEADIDCSTSADCEGLIPGSPMSYLSTFGKLELLGIPQIFYEKVICNSNQEKVFPDLYQATEGTEIKSSTKETVLTGLPSFDSLNKIGLSESEYADTARWYSEENSTNLLALTTSTTGQKYPDSAVYKDNISKPDIFSENEFLCCIKLGEDATSADQCCSGHAVFKDGDASKGMKCMLPYGANLNVYFNRFVSSDGLLEDATLRGDEDPIGFLQSQFNPHSGEVRPNEETDEVLKALGEKYCTSDLGNNPNSQTPGAVRRGSAVGNYPAGPFVFYNPSEFRSGPQRVAADPEFRRLSFVDNPRDSETDTFTSGLEHPRGYYPYLAGYRWNHHFYCTGVPGGN